MLCVFNQQRDFQKMYMIIQRTPNFDPICPFNIKNCVIYFLNTVTIINYLSRQVYLNFSVKINLDGQRRHEDDKYIQGFHMERN